MILTTVKGFHARAATPAGNVNGIAPACALPALDIDIHTGLTAVVGDEGAGKTALLAAIAESHHDVCFFDHGLVHVSQQEQHDTPEAIWAHRQLTYPNWQPDLAQELATALDLDPHKAKPLYMLSTGSKRKVGLVSVLSAGTAVTCVDQPFAALDLPSIRVLIDFWQDCALSTQRAWVIADYVASPQLAWRNTITL